METKAVRDQAGAIICARCRIADNPWTRLRGLPGRSGLDAGEWLLIKPTNSIRMMFMRFAIDAVFLDRDLVVLRVVPNLKPWRIANRAPCPIGARTARRYHRGNQHHGRRQT